MRGGRGLTHPLKCPAIPQDPHLAASENARCNLDSWGNRTVIKQLEVKKCCLGIIGYQVVGLGIGQITNVILTEDRVTGTAKEKFVQSKMVPVVIVPLKGF